MKPKGSTKSHLDGGRKDRSRSPPVLRSPHGMVPSDPRGIETYSKAKKRGMPGIELVVARQTQKLSTRQRRPAVSNKAQRSPYTPQADVAEPEPLALHRRKPPTPPRSPSSSWSPSRRSQYASLPLEGKVSLTAVRHITRVRSEAACGKQEGGCANQRGARRACVQGRKEQRPQDILSPGREWRQEGLHTRNR